MHVWQEALTLKVCACRPNSSDTALVEAVASQYIMKYPHRLSDGTFSRPIDWLADGFFSLDFKVTDSEWCEAILCAPRLSYASHHTHNHNHNYNHHGPLISLTTRLFGWMTHSWVLVSWWLPHSCWVTQHTWTRCVGVVPRPHRL